MRGKTRRTAHPATKPSRSAHLISPPSTRYLFFGGKGGVGKTTAAAACALHLLDIADSNERLLVFSTDPAHSLSDSFGVRIGDRLTEVARNGDARLYAYEMNATAALERFKVEHHHTLAEIADRGTLLDEADINELLNLSLPGMDEIMALFELSELDLKGDYSRVIVDTAPSGHTSRLLQLPAIFARMVEALDRMADKHRYLIAHFARGARVHEDEVDRFIRELTERIERVRTMLHDEERMSFTLVAIPEAMSVEETSRYFSLLRAEEVPVRDLIINRIEHEHDDCRYCRARVAGQKQSLKKLAAEFKPLRLHRVPLFPEEVLGVDALRLFGKIVWAAGDDLLVTSVRAARAKQRTAAPDQAKGVELPQPDLLMTDRRLLIFGGKGGVGKTTSAAATALALAKARPSDRILLFSTDPAHSLTDSLGETIGESKRKVAGVMNLDAMEIDPRARFEELKSRYRKWTDELFSSLGGSKWEVQFDREAMRDLVSLAPPGIDEIAALSAISDLLDQNRYTTIVLDTAPTGHLLRFLELPDVALSWVRTFIRLLLKYQNVVRSTGVAEELIALSKNIKRVIALLTDRKACEFIGVAIPERMSLEETERLLKALKRLKLPMKRLLINGILPREASACGFCDSRRHAQQLALEGFRGALGKQIRLLVAPQQPHDIRGANQLQEHFAGWQYLMPLRSDIPAGKRGAVKRTSVKSPTKDSEIK